MLKIFRLCDLMMILVDYKDLELYKYFVVYIIVFLGGDMVWKINKEQVKCRGICIDLNVLYIGVMFKDGLIVFLFIEISRYVILIKKKYFKGEFYVIFVDDVVDRMFKEYMKNQMNKENLYLVLLQQCEIDNLSNCEYEERIEEIFFYIKRLKIIEYVIVDDLCNNVFILKSRLFYLFK